MEEIDEMTPEQELYNRLSDDEKKFYLKFNAEADSNSPKTQWGKDRRKDRAKDVYDRFNQQKFVPRYYLSAYRPNFDDAVNREIDLERSVCPSNDLAPGLIRTEAGYKCAVIVPHGVERAFFSFEEDAKEWISQVKAKYKDHCYDTY